jgi:hypothetical protein
MADQYVDQLRKLIQLDLPDEGAASSLLMASRWL